MEECRVRCHDDGWKRRDVGLGALLALCLARFLGGEVVGEDLVDAEDNVGEQERRLNRVSSPASNTESAEEDGSGHGNAN